MSQVTINLPEEVFSARRLPPEEFVGDLRLAAAIYWFEPHTTASHRVRLEGRPSALP